MPRPVDRPNKVGEHQTLKPEEEQQSAIEDEESRTERMPALEKALDESEKLWEQGTRDS
jgi:hypothetical protein